METYRLEEVESTKYAEYKRDFEAKIETFYVKQDIFLPQNLVDTPLFQPIKTSPNKDINLVLFQKTKATKLMHR